MPFPDLETGVLHVILCLVRVPLVADTTWVGEAFVSVLLCGVTAHVEQIRKCICYADAPWDGM